MELYYAARIRQTFTDGLTKCEIELPRYLFESIGLSINSDLYCTVLKDKMIAEDIEKKIAEGPEKKTVISKSDLYQIVVAPFEDKTLFEQMYAAECDLDKNTGTTYEVVKMFGAWKINLKDCKAIDYIRADQGRMHFLLPFDVSKLRPQDQQPTASSQDETAPIPDETILSDNLNKKIRDDFRLRDEASLPLKPIGIDSNKSPIYLQLNKCFNIPDKFEFTHGDLDGGNWDAKEVNKIELRSEHCSQCKHPESLCILESKDGLFYLLCLGAQSVEFLQKEFAKDGTPGDIDNLFVGVIGSGRSDSLALVLKDPNAEMNLSHLFDIYDDIGCLAHVLGVLKKRNVDLRIIQPQRMRHKQIEFQIAGNYLNSPYRYFGAFTVGQMLKADIVTEHNPDVNATWRENINVRIDAVLGVTNQFTQIELLQYHVVSTIDGDNTEPFERCIFPSAGDKEVGDKTGEDALLRRNTHLKFKQLLTTTVKPSINGNLNEYFANQKQHIRNLGTKISRILKDEYASQITQTALLEIQPSADQFVKVCFSDDMKCSYSEVKAVKGKNVYFCFYKDETHCVAIACGFTQILCCLFYDERQALKWASVFPDSIQEELVGHIHSERATSFKQKANLKAKRESFYYEFLRKLGDEGRFGQTDTSRQSKGADTSIDIGTQNDGLSRAFKVELDKIQPIFNRLLQSVPERQQKYVRLNMSAPDDIATKNKLNHFNSFYQELIQHHGKFLLIKNDDNGKLEERMKELDEIRIRINDLDSRVGQE